MAKKQYENFTVFGARIYGMKHLWNPSTEYQGKKQERPNYMAGFLVPKTQPHWSQEPIFQNMFGAMQKIHAAALAALPYDTPNLWPIRDGDMPQDPQRPPADWARGHWMFSGNSGDVIKVELSQGQSLVPLQARGNVVKPGDFVIVAGAAAINSQSNRAIKLYINNVVFTAPGEEIAIGNSISGAELMATAAAQGYRPTGFNPSPQGGFAQPGGFAGAPQGGFTGPGAGAPAPMTGGSPAPSTAPSGAGFGGGAAFPSSGAPQPGFGQPAAAFGGQPAMQPGPGFGAPTPGNGATAFPSNSVPQPGGFAPPNPNGWPQR